MDTKTIIFLAAIGLLLLGMGLFKFFKKSYTTKYDRPFEPAPKPRLPQLFYFSGEAMPSQTSSEKAFQNYSDTRDYITIDALKIGTTVYNSYPDSKCNGRDKWICLEDEGGKKVACKISTNGTISKVQFQ